MAMYWLAKEGVSTGPYGEGRLADMWSRGEIGPDDLLALHGTEDWFTAEAMLPGVVEEGEMARPQPVMKTAERVQRRPLRGFAVLLGIAGLLLGLGGCGVWSVYIVEGAEAAREDSEDLKLLSGMAELEPERALAMLRKAEAGGYLTLIGEARAKEVLVELEGRGTLGRDGEAALRDVFRQEMAAAVDRATDARASSNLGRVVGGIGWLMVLISVVIDRSRWLCGGCGNRVDKTSSMCPACGTSLG